MKHYSIGKKRSREATPSERLESATMVNAETDTDNWPPTPSARRAPPVTTLLDLPPEMLIEIAQRVDDARALASAACSCRALRDAADDRTAWASALERALPGVHALLEASPPDWALEKKEKKKKMTKKKKRKRKNENEDEEKDTAAAAGTTTLKHPKLLLAALASGREFHAQVFNRELDNEAEDFLLSCYDARLSLERWRPSAGDEGDGEGEEEEKGEEGGDAATAAAPSAGVLTRARAAAAAAAAALASAASAAAAPSSSSSSPSSSSGECPRSPRLTRRRSTRPEEEKVTAAAAAAVAAAAVAAAAEAEAATVVAAAAAATTTTTTPEQQRNNNRKKKSGKRKSSPPGLPLRGISPTYTARYLPMGRSLAVETGVGAGRLRAAPRQGGDGGGSSGNQTTPPSSFSSSSSSSFSLSPGDAVEVQWKAMESHPYGSWLGCVVSVFSPEGSGTATTAAVTATAAATTNDDDDDDDDDGQGNRNGSASAAHSTAATVDIIFQQYSPDSPWQVVHSVPLLPPGSNVDSPVNGDPTFGFVGGVRGPLGRAELERWEGAWRSAEAAALARGRARPARALSAGLARAPSAAAAGAPPPAPDSAAPPALVS